MELLELFYRRLLPFVPPGAVLHHTCVPGHGSHGSSPSSQAGILAQPRPVLISRICPVPCAGAALGCPQISCSLAAGGRTAPAGEALPCLSCCESRLTALLLLQVPCPSCLLTNIIFSKLNMLEQKHCEKKKRLTDLLLLPLSTPAKWGGMQS